uniref:sterol desaturase family protein n=1 Tax=Thaumasiovibrio occultus TaxID=1891184 RepID=UPI00192D1869|nr:sterol desaturase family protein [Thaumasiovibrio occultus]
MTEHADGVRLVAFASLLVLFMLAEAKWPRRDRAVPRKTRWFANIAVVMVSSIATKLVLPLLAFDFAQQAQAQQWGVLNHSAVQQALPLWATTLLAIVLLDCAIYWQHRLFHRIPLLWRLHRMHHTDIDFDVTTASRFHPIEIILSMVIKISLVVSLGISPLAIVLFEVILNGSAMFNHSNLRLPLPVDKRLRWLIVTPDFHRVHHSVHNNEMHRNFGFFLSVWDRIFGSYCAQPKDGHLTMTIGTKDFRDANEQGLLAILLQPFRR